MRLSPRRTGAARRTPPPFPSRSPGPRPVTAWRRPLVTRPSAPRPAITAAVAGHAAAPRSVGVLLVRLGGYAAGVFTGYPPALADAKAGSRLVHGRSAAGGWSQHRFARRREKQASEALDAAADAAVLVFTRWESGPRRTGPAGKVNRARARRVDAAAGPGPPGRGGARRRQAGGRRAARRPAARPVPGHRDGTVRDRPRPRNAPSSRRRQSSSSR